MNIELTLSTGNVPHRIQSAYGPAMSWIAKSAQSSQDGHRYCDRYSIVPQRIEFHSADNHSLCKYAFATSQNENVEINRREVEQIAPKLLPMLTN